VRLSAIHHSDKEPSSTSLLTMAMMEMLRTNQIITSLTLSRAFHSSICYGISANRHCALTSLHLHVSSSSSSSGQGDDLVATRHLLQNNHTLQFLRIDGILTDDAIVHVAQGLAQNTGLCELVLCTTTTTNTVRRSSIHLPTTTHYQDGIQVLIQVLKDSNTTLQYIRCLSSISNNNKNSNHTDNHNHHTDNHHRHMMMKRLEYYCSLNRAGRGEFRTCSSHDDWITKLHSATSNIHGSDGIGILYGLLLDVPPQRWFS
jgi:hypothetical protein